MGGVPQEGPVVVLLMDTGKTVQPLLGEVVNPQIGGEITQTVCCIEEFPHPLDCTYSVIV